MNTFGNSISTRYMQLADIIAKQGVDIDEAHKLLIADRDAFVADENDEHPETHPYQDNFAETLGKDSYGGDYIIDEAAEFWRTDGDKWVNADPQERMESFRERGYVKMVDNMRDLCHAVNCDFDRWFSERSLYVKDTEGETAGTSAVDRAFEKLDKMGYLYTKDGALWFRSTDLGDDKDRVLIKSDGEYTYFASDVAYHWDKFQRVDHVIDIWGADHHGYIERVRCVCDALGYPGKFEVLLGQLVNLLRNGKPVRMSKRKGTMVTLQELVDEVGSDAARYTLISKSSNQMVDFDIEAVKKRDNSNPVYYVQYAHARVCSILRRAADVTPEQADEMGMKAVAAKAIGENVDYSLLTDPTELALSRKLNELTDLIASCARDRAPFRLTHFAEELAGDFHSFYAACQVLPSEGRPVDPSFARPSGRLRRRSRDARPGAHPRWRFRARADVSYGSFDRVGSALLSPISPISMRRSGFLRLVRLFGLLGNATKLQLYRFTGLNRQLATMVPIVKLNPQVDGLLFLDNAGYGWLAASWPRNPA